MRKAIDEALREKGALDEISGQYGVSINSLKLHMSHGRHLEGAPEWAADQLRDRLSVDGWLVDPTKKMTLLAKIAEKELIRVVGKARKKDTVDKLVFTAMDKFRAVLRDLHEMRKTAKTETEVQEVTILPPILAVARSLEPKLRKALIEALEKAGFPLDESGNVVIEQKDEAPDIPTEDIKKLREQFRKSMKTDESEEAWEEFLNMEIGKEVVKE